MTSPSKMIHPVLAGKPGVAVGRGVGVGLGSTVGVSVDVSDPETADAGMRAKSRVMERRIGKANGQPKQTSPVSSVMTA